MTESTSGHAQYDIAGNVVKTLDPRSTTSNLIATTFDFSDRFGSPDDDARANSAPSQLGGQSSFTFATKVTNALGHEAYTQFDYFLGKPVNSEDANGIVSSVAYNDALDRPTQGIQARYKVGVGVTSAKRQTTFVYDDTNRTTTTTGDRDAFNDNILTGKAYYDGLGRTWRGATYEGNTGAGNTWAITDTQFDALGRVSQVSNPYRAADPASASPPSGTWTTTIYDALSRVTTVQTPDTATVTTAYSGNAVTVTDQAGKQRRSLTDAMGRLIRVDEPSGCDTCLGIVSSPTQPTDYLYDALGNLRKVTQGTQTRWFGYDSLSRLIRVKNSEQAVNSSLPAYTDPVTGGSGWSMAYFYDANGNLTQKTDARNISVTYVYDALNRNTSVDYDNTTISPDVYRFYDNAAIANGKGRFSHDYHGDIFGSQSAEHKAIDGYDPLGRPLSARQLFKTGATWSNSFITSQTYDLAGNVKTMTYPSGRVVNYGYNTAGQLASFTGKLGGLTGGGPGGDVNYATAMQYNPRGQMIRETFGTNTALYQRKHYNRRGQLFDIRLGTDSSSSWDVEDPQIWQWANGSWNRGALRLFYSPNLNDYSGPNPAQPLNNGNLHRMDHFVPNALSGDTITSWVMGSDDYLYDELNRLTRVAETPTGGTGSGFVQQFTYDRWGNRKIDVNATTNLTGITRIDFKVLTANNRLVAPSDVTGDDPGTDLMRYDKSGNLVYDNYSAAVGQRGVMKYDAENRMIEAVNNSHQYRYDADGKRTRRLVAGSLEMWLVYGVSGELVAEYDAVLPGGMLKKEYGYRGGQMLIVYDATLSGDNRLKWMVTDHLGSTRMLVNQSGGLCGAIERRDYLPFGEELASTIGHRNAPCAGYVGGNNPRQKFTNYERDGETGLDFAQARYFGSLQGRFTGPDPYNPIVDTEDSDEFNEYLGQPQNWNRYAFVWNNPLKYTDPYGERVYVVSYTYGNSNSDESFKAAAETRANEIRKQKDFDPKKDTVLVRGVYAKDDFKNLLQDANSLEKQFGQVEQVTLFAHSGPSEGPVFHDRTTGKGDQFKTSELAGLKVNWSSTASATFIGCNTADNFTQRFADAQNVPTYGYDKYAYFSSSSTKMVPNPKASGPVYLIAADYGTHNGIGSAIRYKTGNGLVYPLIRRDPKPKK